MPAHLIKSRDARKWRSSGAFASCSQHCARGAAASGPVIAVNFQTKKKVKLSDRCLCGSGLPYIICCGRTPGKEELMSGIF